MIDWLVQSQLFIYNYPLKWNRKTPYMTDKLSNTVLIRMFQGKLLVFNLSKLYFHAPEIEDRGQIVFILSVIL